MNRLCLCIMVFFLLSGMISSCSLDGTDPKDTALDLENEEEIVTPGLGQDESEEEILEEVEVLAAEFISGKFIS